MTQENIKKIQSILKALGNSPGAVDGIWGNNTQAALDATYNEYCKSSFDKLVESTLPSVKQPDSGIPSFWKDIKYFNRSEFRCQCGGKYCNGYESEPKEKLIRIADEIRREVNAPAHVTSGIRCRKHNAETPNAASNSKHITGEAMDFYVDGMTASTLLAKCRAKPGIVYAYAVNDRIVHMNI